MTDTTSAQNPISIDAKIQSLFCVLNTQKAEVEAAEAETKKSWKTNCSFLLNVASTNVNIQTAPLSILIEVQAELLLKAQYYTKAAEMLGVEYDGKWGNFSISDWQEDLTKRAAIINLSGKKAKLAELEKRLSGIVSPEQRRAMELDAITKSLEG
jgi:hypothetical protein